MHISARHKIGKVALAVPEGATPPDIRRLIFGHKVNIALCT